MDFGEAIGYGVEKPDFWIGARRPARAFASRTSHSRPPTGTLCRAFFDAAVATGAEVLHEPRLWPEYHERYFGAFVRDPDGNNVEAVCHTG